MECDFSPHHDSVETFTFVALEDGTVWRTDYSHIGAYSAHADRGDLLRFLEPAKAWGSRICVVHGDELTCFGFAGRLAAEGPHDVLVPETYAIYRLGRVETAAA